MGGEEGGEKGRAGRGKVGKRGKEEGREGEGKEEGGEGTPRKKLTNPLRDGCLAGRVSGEHHSVQSVAKKLTDERDRVVVGSR